MSLPKSVVFPRNVFKSGPSTFFQPNLKFFPFWLVIFFCLSSIRLSDLLFCVVLPEKYRPQDFCFL
jgi:hypothetical protein